MPEVSKLDFSPGQFVSLTDQVGGKAITRAYSVCSAPGGNCFELCLNRVEEGSFSPHLFGLTPGDTVPMIGPLGSFKLREPLGDSVMVATGTGIAPFRSMLNNQTLASGKEFTLIFGVRYEHGLFYRDEFEAIEREHAGFQFVPVLSRPEKSWKGRTGHVQPHLMEIVGARRDLDVYICGLKEMVDDIRRVLKEAGFDRRRLVYEKYD